MESLSFNTRTQTLISTLRSSTPTGSKVSRETNNQIALLQDGMYSQFIGMADCIGSPQYPVSNSRLVDWSMSQFDWPSGSTFQTYTVGTTSLAIKVTESSPGLLLHTTPVTDTTYQGNQPTPVTSLVVGVSLPAMGTTEYVTTTVSFDLAVANVSFDLFNVRGDVSPAFRHEKYKIFGLLNGQPVRPLYFPRGDQQYIGDLVTGISPSPSTGIGSQGGVVGVWFFSPIDQFVIVYSVAPSPAPTILPGSTSGFGLYNVAFNDLDRSINAYTSPSRYRFATCQDVLNLIPTRPLANVNERDFNLAIESQGNAKLVSLRHLTDNLDVWVVGGVVEESPPDTIPTKAIEVPFKYFYTPNSTSNPSAPIYVGAGGRLIIPEVGVTGVFELNYSVILQQLGFDFTTRVGVRLESSVVGALQSSRHSQSLAGDILLPGSVSQSKAIHTLTKSVLFRVSEPTEVYLTIYAEKEDQWRYYDANQAANPSGDFPPPLINGEDGGVKESFPALMSIKYLGTLEQVNKPY
jgi:hypothetical protein